MRQNSVKWWRRRGNGRPGVRNVWHEREVAPRCPRGDVAGFVDGMRDSDGATDGFLVRRPG